MNQDERNMLGKTIAFTAAYYSRELQKEVLSMMVDDLSDLPFDLINQAYSMYRRDPKNRAFPLPAQIRDIVDPVETPEERAREIAARIEGAIVRFGHPNEAEARHHIGDEGWSIVQRYGGWSHLCANHGLSITPASFHAQVRDQLSTALRGKPDRHLVSLNPGERPIPLTGAFSSITKPLPWEER